MPVKVPGVKRRPWWSKDWPHALGGGLPTIAAAGIGIFNATGDGKTPAWVIKMLWGIASWSAVVLLAKVWQTYAKDKKQDDQEHPLDLLGPLHIIDHVIRRQKGISATESSRKFRLTIHRVDGDAFEQCVPYVGTFGTNPELAGRRFPVKCGLVGQLIRAGTPSPKTARRKTDDYTAYIGSLVEHWGYSQDEARKLATDRFSGLAVPVQHDGVTVAVVYGDSDDREFFDPETVELITSSVYGLAEWVRKRYPASK